MLSFNLIPGNIRTPGQYIEFDESRAINGLPALAQKILVIGQRLPTGVITANVPRFMSSGASAEAYFGRGSMLANMIAALKIANRYTETWAVALDDLVAGAIATGKFSFTGAATQAGTMNLYLGGERVQVGVTVGMTAAQLATAAAAAINANTKLIVTAAAVLDDCNISFRHKGETGNSFDLRWNYSYGEATPKGLSVTTTPMSAGTGNPDIATAISAIGDDQYHTIIMPYVDASNLTKIETEMARRWGPMVQREGQAFAAVSGSTATMTTLGAARNSPHLTIMAAGKSPSPPWIVATVTGAVDAFEPDPARPRHTLPLSGVLAPSESGRATREERNTLLHSGISTFIVDAGGYVRIERLITTFQEDLNGDPDESYLDIETLRTLAYLRTSTRIRIADRFPRHKLADDGTQFSPGQAIVTPVLIRMELLHLFREWEAAGLAENFDQFKTDLVVERNAIDRNRVDALIPPDLVNQFRVFAAAVQFRL